MHERGLHRDHEVQRRNQCGRLVVVFDRVVPVVYGYAVRPRKIAELGGCITVLQVNKMAMRLAQDRPPIRKLR
jgi:hypothetical protein